MYIDFDFFSYMQDDDGSLDENIMHGIIEKCLTDAKAYYETDKYKYFIYSFTDENSKLLIRVRKNNGKLEYDDFQTFMDHGTAIKSTISAITEDDKCILTIREKGLMPVRMDAMGFKENEEVNILYNFFPSRIEFFNDEEDYYANMKGKNGELNIFDWEIGDVAPVIALIKGNRKNYSNVTDETLSNFRDDFLVASGKLVNSKTIENIIKIEPVKEIPDGKLRVGKYDYFEFETKVGKMSVLVSDMIMNDSLESQNKKSVELTDKTIIKVYGYAGAIIDLKINK